MAGINERLFPKEEKPSEGFPIITPDPYSVENITASLEASRAAIAEQMELQAAQWIGMEATLNQQAAESRAAIITFNEGITAALNTALTAPEAITIPRGGGAGAGVISVEASAAIDITGIVAPMRAALKEQVTGMRAAYTAQVAVQAKQLDAAVGTGVFGGNSLRAQQAYQASMNNLMGQTLGQIATMTLSAEGSILSTVGQLSGLQAQIRAGELGLEAQLRAQAQGQSDQIEGQLAGLEAQLNAEQSNRFRELQANREIQLIGMLGQAAELTVEAGSILTNNWLNYLSSSNQSTARLLELMANIDITEAGIRQQQARDLFSAEMQAITNNANLQIAYRNAAATEFAAIQQRRAAKRASNAARYAAELRSDTDIRVAEIGAGAAIDIANIEVAGQISLQDLEQGSVLDILKILG